MPLPWRPSFVPSKSRGAYASLAQTEDSGVELNSLGDFSVADEAPTRR